MATIYLRSADGDDGDDGSTWGLAKATVQAALTAAGSGGLVYMDDDHQETWATLTTLTSPGTIANPTAVICVTTDTITPVSSPPATYNFQTTTNGDTFVLAGYTYYWGVNFDIFEAIYVNGGNSAILENCYFVMDESDGTNVIYTTTDSAYIELIDCELDGVGLRAGRGGTIIWKGGSYAADATNEVDHIAECSTEGGTILVDGVDLSAFDNTALITSAVSEGDQSYNIQITNCKIATGVAFSGGTIAVRSQDNVIKVHGCGDADQYYQYYEVNYAGIVTEETTIKRSGGATYDGTNEYSLNLATNASAKEYLVPLRFKLCSLMVDATSEKTLKVHIAYDDPVLNNDDIWIEVKYHDATNQAHGKWARTKPATRVSAPDRDAFTDVSGSETWDGAAQDNEETIEQAITGGNGLVDVWVCLAVPSTIVYVCPKVEVS